MNYFRIDFNTNLISEDSFIIALSKLVWTDGGSYVEPIIDHLSEHNTKYIQNDSQHNINMILTKLYDTDDKIILPDNKPPAPPPPAWSDADAPPPATTKYSIST